MSSTALFPAHLLAALHLLLKTMMACTCNPSTQGPEIAGGQAWATKTLSQEEDKKKKKEQNIINSNSEVNRASRDPFQKVFRFPGKLGTDSEREAVVQESQSFLWVEIATPASPVSEHYRPLLRAYLGFYRKKITKDPRE